MLRVPLPRATGPDAQATTLSGSVLPTLDDQLRPIVLADIPAVRDLAKSAYPPGLLAACLETLAFHQECLSHGIDDGRILFTYHINDRLVGACGLHRYIWGPSSVCWGSWFFIGPRFRRPGLARRMFLALLEKAREQGFERFYVETPAADPKYARVALYLPRLGFSLEATLADFYEPHVDQLLFRLDL